MQEVTEKIKKDAEVRTFMNPRYVFLPIKDGFKLRVKDNEYVYKNDIVAINRDDKMIHSSVSGRVLGVKTLGRAKLDVPSLVIENDFKENMRVRKSARKFLSNIEKTDFLNSLEDAGLTYKNGHIKEKLAGDVEVLVINGIELEPVFHNKNYIFEENIEDILETVDLVGNITKAKRIILAVCQSEADIISALVNSIGTYPNIELKLMDDAYPNGSNVILLKKLSLDGALILDLEEIYNIHEVLKRDMPVTEKYISIVGEGIRDGGVIKVKIGSLLSEVFISNFDFAIPNVDVYLNGPIHGKKVNTLKYVVDDDLDGIYVEEKHEKKPDACINCGLCSKSCPMGLNPKYVFDHKGNVRSEYYEACIKCGLCSHICPSNIDLRSYMKGVDEK